MVKDMAGQTPATKLLTLLNVQSAKPSAPKRTRDWHALARKAHKTSTATTAAAERARKGLAHKLEQAAHLLDSDEGAQGAAQVEGNDAQGLGQADEGAAGEGDDDGEDDSLADSFARHWSAQAHLVKGKDKAGLEAEHDGAKKGKAVWPGVGDAQVLRPEAVGADEGKVPDLDEALKLYNPKLLDKLRSRSSRTSVPPTQAAWLRTLSTYQDVLFPRVTIGSAEHDAIREASALHAMNHVLKTRTRILKNNEHLAKQALDPSSSSFAAAPPRDTLDQSFTRPKVLLLTPFRNSALAWVQHLVHYLPPSTSLVENYPRFVSEYSLPDGAEDKLVANADQYPPDHVATFAGNIDDSFRCGVKLTRKSAKMFAEFYQADVIVASPLGLRTSIEKDGDSDFLSSIEVLIVDQMDVMLMQNWDHVQFVLERLNHLPATDHGIDFSRVKPWYLDGLAPFLRQSILLSSFDAPELRAVLARQCHNRAGRVRALGAPRGEEDGVLDRVPRGVRQVWSRFDASDPYEEDDRRFEWFTTKTLPTLLKSAVSSSQTIVFVPSYFDFVRVKRYLTKHLSSLGSDFSFAAISEYTPTPDVSRARGAFFAGKKKFLLVTERFHFFRRYRLRGAKTVVFYAPPQHPSYYPEFLSFPFSAPAALEPDADVNASELSAHVVFSRFDLLRLERIVGERDARRMCGVGREAASESRFTFV
ncbi:rRNA-binding ribosome biosynthesis protein UTP25 [Rhodotorula paludigena]|uniref:rRNA-binding ribosome biosynthesis protein UTP25 n=1 Tax=Rhodotorula paludigena TaxID=86838 RepID=UPI00317D5349